MMTRDERIATLVTIRTLVEGLLKAETGTELTCCEQPAIHNYGTFDKNDFRCQNCGTPVEQ